MEQLVEELKKAVKFKDITEPGDIVLVAIDTPRSLFYARVRGFERDNSRRDEWWHVDMQLLTVPPQDVVWTLRREQFTGRDIFTMGGDKRFIQAVDLDGSPPSGKNGGEGGKDKLGRAKLQVIK